MPDLTLVVGDAHVATDQNLRRFKWANRYIHSLGDKLKRIVIIGDFLTLDCFSDWDKDKRKKMEGRRYWKEIAVGDEALHMLLDGVDCSKTPIIVTEGNHEERAKRYIDYHPELDGTVSIKQDLFDHFGCTYVPYKQDWTYKGVSFTHVPIQENGKPVAGKYATIKALNIYHNSVVFGHTHKLDLACEHRHNSLHLNQAVNVGCFFEHVDEYARGSVTSYWRGLVLLDHYAFNRVDVTTLSLGSLKRLYNQP